MKKFSLSLILSLIIMGGLFAQDITNAFFDKVSYIGAFDGVTYWTAGWTEWNPVNKVYADATVTKGNGQFSRSAGVHITASETWSGVIKLDGWVYVDDGATLTIAAGTVIRGTEKSVLVIERGAKIMAVGTSTNPIVFTSNKGAGLRANSDWAGLVICGKAINNIAGGVGTTEGGIESQYGGTVADDNSGELKYVRIEFPGYEVATGKEVNGLTLCSVGSATKINYIQVSYSGDDGYEWFGGSVNAKYLISYKTEDDDFDTDNGYNGMIQFGLISRDPEIAEVDDAANGFESDNDASGSGATPFTSAIFSNISAFGPAKSATEPATLKTNHAGGSALRLRRNTKLQIYNSAFMGWGMGLRLESDGSQTAANSDVLTIKNTIVSGIRGDKFKEDGTVFDATTLQAWFLATSRENQLVTNNADVKITDAFNYNALNFQPAAGSLALNASYWYDASQNTGVASIDNSFFDHVRYIGALDGVTDWTAGWTEWNPVNKVYADATVTKGNGQFSRSAGVHITASETWSGVIKLDGWVYVDDGATLTIAAGTVIRGTEKSVLVIERGAKIMAVGTSTNPIVFTSNKGAGLRANSDWAGLVICGKAINNIAGGVGTTEGGIESQYGGTVADDNSGELKYVRIEFPGYEVATGKEVNGLTLCSVGSATKINYIQVSYSGDDGYEWFGGSVNAKYLISYKTEDDDFDTDNGYNGMIQFGLISRDPEIAEVDDAANGFESDNDASGSGATPFTSAIFSNISAFGPAKSATEPATLKTNHAGGSALRLRRNTKLQIYNSAFMGWGMGLRLESDGSQTAANSDVLTIKNTIVSGIRGDKFKEDGTVFDATTLQAWFLATARENQLVTNNADVKITDPYNYTALNFQPAAGSLVLNASYWVPTAVNPMAISNEASLVNYPNPFSGSTNIELQVEKESNVSMFIFDLSGRKVAVLHEGKLTEGTHHFVFDGSALPKGLYFAKVTTGIAQKVVKMISK